MGSWALGTFVVEFASFWLVLSFRVKLYLKSCCRHQPPPLKQRTSNIKHLHPKPTKGQIEIIKQFKYRHVVRVLGYEYGGLLFYIYEPSLFKVAMRAGSDGQQSLRGA